MSKQRPYGTFEEAYILQMIMRAPESLDRFILSLIQLENVFDNANAYEMIQIPPMFRVHLLVKEYWYGLCRMYGDVCVPKCDSYILAENIHLCVEHVVDLIRKLFPPGWDSGSEPILKLYKIKFI